MRMMIKRTKILLWAGFIALCFVLGALFINSERHFAIAETVMQTEVKSSYFVGESFEIPQKVTLSDGNKSEESKSGRLIFPDGINYSCGQMVQLNQLGNYKLVYESENLFAEKSFSVFAKNWSVSSSRSSVSYGDLSYSNIVKSDGTKTLNADETGLRLNLAEGDKFTYHVPINVYDYERLDVIQAYPRVWTENQRTCYASFVTVKLVDYYNTENYVEFYVWCDYLGNSGTYLGAGASNQSLVGLEVQQANPNTSKALFFEDTWYKRHNVDRYVARNQYGASAGSGKSNNLLFYRGGMNFQFDPHENRVYTTTNYYYENTDSRRVDQTKMINDLDAPEIYTDYSDNIFEGFTTGEVYLELQCQLYGEEAKGSVEIQIESLLGLTGEELIQGAYSDTTAPVIEVPAMENVEKMNVIKGELVRIPEAIVYDVNYYGAPSVNVYYNYASSERVLVYSKDGQFTACLDGDYTIVYTAVDSFGNHTEKLITVGAKDGKLFDYEEEKLTSMTAGVKVSLPQITAVGINGDVATEICVYDPKGNFVELQDNSFVPMMLGEYTVEYSFSDNFAQKIWSYQVACKDEGVIGLSNEVSLPPAFLKGATYKIQNYNVYVFGTEGPIAKETSIFCCYNGAELKALSSQEKEKFVVTEGEEVVFEYRFNGETVLQRTIPVIANKSDGTKDLSKYFVGDYISAELGSKNSTYIFDSETSQASLTFMNLIPFKNFYLGYSIPENYGNFSRIKISLIDYLNGSEVVEITYTKQQDGIVIQSGEHSEKIKGMEFSGTSFALWFEKVSTCITTDGGLHFPVTPLSGHLCTLKVEIDGITGASGFSVARVNNQMFNTRAQEAVPEININYPEGLMAQYSTYVAKAPEISSVLTPLLVNEDIVTLSVYSPNDDEIVKDVNGLSLKEVDGSKTYEIVMSEVGYYTFVYMIKVGRQMIPMNYVVNVVDTIAPTITFENGINENTLIKLKVGMKHKIKSFIVSDNVSLPEELLTYVFVFDAGHRIEAYGKELSEYVFEKAGYYTICVMSKDKSGNLASAYYNVLAE